MNSERTKLGFGKDQYALLILDVFSGQMTEPVKEMLRENFIHFARVPANMTNLFQPLDLTVNRSFKAFMKKKFTEWFSKQIADEMDKGIQLEDIDIKLRISILKPLHAKWMVEVFNLMTSQAGREVISNGWKAAGITEAIKKGLSWLESLDPFQSIDPLVELDETVDQSDQVNDSDRSCFVTAKNLDVEESDDEDWVLDGTEEDERSAFDLYEDI